MRLQQVQEALKEKKIVYEYTEEDGLGSLDFDFRPSSVTSVFNIYMMFSVRASPKSPSSIWRDASYVLTVSYPARKGFPLK